MKFRLPPVPVLALALIVPLLAAVPTWQGFHYESPPDRVFLGFRYMAGDHYQYAALMRQAQHEGRFLMENRYTTEPQKRVYVFLYYWMLGTAARLTGISLVAAWEVFRLVGGFLYIVAFWALTRHFLPDDRRRLLATLLFSLAGGLDWIVTAARAAGLTIVEPLEHPYDYYWNWSTFGTMLVPNWIWPALVWTVVCLMLLGRSRVRDLATFLLPPVIWGLHHHTALVVYLTLGLLPVMPVLVAAARLQKVDWARVRSNLRAALPGLASFGLVVVYLMWARQDDVFRLNAAMSFQWKSHFSIWWYPLAYGLLMPLAWFGMKDLADDRGPGRDLIFSWLLGAATLSLNPLAGGAKYQYLIFPPLVLAATRGYYHLKQRSAGSKRLFRSRPAVAALCLLLFLDAPVSLVKDMPEVRSDPEIYATEGEIEAMRWLDGQPEGVVVCSYRMGHLVPWLAGKKVYAGHWFMTLDLNTKVAQIGYLFSPQVPLEAKRQILRRTGARYIFDGPSEARLGTLDPALGLRRVYEKQSVTIFEVPAGL